MLETPFIKVENLKFKYPSTEQGVPGKEILHGISLTIQKGEYVAVLGHNGSGKSTFAKLLNLILDPTSGKIWIDGVDITDQNLTDEQVLALRKKMGMVFQNPDNQMVATIAEEEVAFGPENLGIPSAEIRKRVDDALAAVGMSEYAKKEPSRLSGGQKQRIAIAGIIAMLPECIIFDESTSMLDPQGRHDVMQIIDMLNCEKGITVIHITHDMNEAARAKRVIVLNEGSILLDGSPDEVFSQPDVLHHAELGVPQCTAFMQALRKRGISLEGDISTPEKCTAILAQVYEQAKGGVQNG